MVSLSFLIVDDELAVGFAAALRKHGERVIAKTIGEAQRALASHAAFDGFVIDVHLPDGNGLDFLSLIRLSDGRHAKTPALVVTGYGHERWANTAYALDAAYLDKPITGAQIDHFVVHWCVRPRIERVANDRADHASLTTTERRILIEYLHALSRDLVAAEQHISHGTLKKHAASIARKAGADSLEDLAMKLLHEALVG